MACKFQQPEFWLPSEFLTDDEILMGHGNLKNTDGRKNDFSDCFPTDFPYDFGPPALGSPVDSFAGSTETESDEEDALSGLTRQLTRATLNSNLPQRRIEKNWVHSGSPQSTLAQIGSWSVRSSGSSNGSPNGPSQVSSPPTSPLGAQSDAWNLIYQAAGQVARMKMHGGFEPARNQGLPGPPRGVHHPVHPSAPMRTPNTCFSNNTHFEQARREQMDRQQSSAMLNRQVKNGLFNEQPVSQNRGLRSGFGGFVESNRCGRVMGDSGQTGWAGLPFKQKNHYQGQSGPGIRAGLVGGYGNGDVVKKRECAGTGVFLPRRYCIQNPTDSRKKPGCSTAWLPARVVESLNKNIDGLNGIPSQPHHQPQPRPSRFNAGFVSEYEILMARRNALLAQQRRNLQQEGTMNLEVRLPQEWTY